MRKIRVIRRSSAIERRFLRSSLRKSVEPAFLVEERILADALDNQGKEGRIIPCRAVFCQPREKRRIRLNTRMADAEVSSGASRSLLEAGPRAQRPPLVEAAPGKAERIKA